MRRHLLIAVMFMASAVAGVLLLLAHGMAAGGLSLMMYRHAHPGTGAVAGGVSDGAVLLVPILCGTIGAIISFNRLKRS